MDNAQYWNDLAATLGQSAAAGAAQAQAAAAAAAAAAPQPKPRRSFGEAIQDIFAGSALGAIVGPPRSQEAPQVIVQDTAPQQYNYNGLILIGAAAAAAFLILKKK
jgi:hypothetical protein